MAGYGRSSEEFTKPAPEQMTPVAAEWVVEVEFSGEVERPSTLRESDIASSIDDLASADFGHRTRGSRALLAYGEEYSDHYVSDPKMNADLKWAAYGDGPPPAIPVRRAKAAKKNANKRNKKTAK